MTTTTRTLPRPPGPHGRPLLGNALEFRHDPLGFLTRVTREYGDVVEIRLGPQRMLVLSRSEDIEDVLVTRPIGRAPSATSGRRRDYVDAGTAAPQ